MGVYKKGNRWLIDYYQSEGTRKREVVTIPGVDPSRVTRQDALKALSIRKAQIAEGKFEIAQTKKPLIFDRLLERHLEWTKDNHKEPERDFAAAKPLLSFFGGKLISNINLWQVDKYKSQRKALGRKPETINKELGVLRRMFNLAIEWKVISSNPVKGIKLLQIPKYIPRVLKEDEFEKLYKAASYHFKPILLCAYLTGMRRGEIAKLRWEDVDFGDGYIFVKETKNNESRAIPIDAQLMDTLLKLQKNSKSQYVFTTHEGKHYTSNTAWKRAWSTALRRSGIGKCRFHGLRHTFCSDLIVGEKEDFATVMELTGHKDMRMLKRYSHTREEAKKAAIRKHGNRLRNIILDTYLDTSSIDSSKISNVLMKLEN